MNILIVNDDGIDSNGIKVLAKLSKKFGRVTVVAPSEQCSAMSQRISIRKEIVVKKINFDIEGFKGGVIEAYSISGTPADCVKIAINYIVKDKIDYIFSGINAGFNMGFDIAYSGTVGAAMEGIMNGIPSIAFSNDYNYNINNKFEIIEKNFEKIVEEILKIDPLKKEIWNVNFPACEPEEVQGILWDRKVASIQIFRDNYSVIEENDNETILLEDGIYVGKSNEGSDVEAVNNNYISIGKISCNVL